MNRSDLTNADMTAALWHLLGDMTGSLDTSGPQGVDESLITGYTATDDTGLPNFNAGNYTAFTPAPTTSMETFTTQLNYSHLGDPSAWAMPAQGFSDAGYISPNLVGNHWTGDSLYAANSAAATPNPVTSPSSSATPPGSQDELARLFGPGQSIYHPTSSCIGGGSEGALVAPEFGADINGVTTYPVAWATNEVAWPIPVAPATAAHTAAPAKRRRDEFQRDGAPVVDGYEMPPQKRARGDKPKGILKAARSAPRTRYQPAARIPKSKTNDEPKEAGRGAGRLATPNSQGIHRQSLLGSSLQQGRAVEAADGQLIWVEGSVEDVVHGIDSTTPQQQQEQEYFEIPKNLRTGYQSLLLATQADRVRGAVREIKCRLCREVKFKNWGDFKRHCNCTETHPLTIYFCDHCGDYFARSDSCQRHGENRPAECLRVTPENAGAKRRATQRAHDDFIEELRSYLTTGKEDIGMSFTKTIKDMYPKSSKKRIRGDGG